MARADRHRPWRNNKDAAGQLGHLMALCTPEIYYYIVLYEYCIDRRIYLNIFQINSKRRRADCFESCCQKALNNVQIVTLIYIYCTKVHVHVSSVLR